MPLKIKNHTYYRLLTNLASFDLSFEALFLCMTFVFASLSIMVETFFNNSCASALSLVALSFLMKVRVVFAWYLFLKYLAWLVLILFNADL